MLHTHLTNDSVTAKANLYNYDGLTNYKEHVKNVKGILELVIIESNAICKIFPTAFHGSTRVWYHSFKTSSILGLYDQCVKLISYFSTSIPAKKFTTFFKPLFLICFFKFIPNYFGWLGILHCYFFLVCLLCYDSVLWSVLQVLKVEPSWLQLFLIIF
jgi:hypothetical protein